MAEKKPLRLLVVGASWPPQTFLGRLMRGPFGVGNRRDARLRPQARPGLVLRSGLRSFRTRDWAGPRLLRLAWVAWLGLRAFVRSPGDLRRFLRHARSEPGLKDRLRTLNRLLPFAGADYDVLYFPWNSAAIDYLPSLPDGNAGARELPRIAGQRGAVRSRSAALPGAFPSTFQKAAADSLHLRGDRKGGGAVRARPGRRRG